MTSTIKTVNCVLNGPGDWDEWLDTIQTAAKVANIWRYINPETQGNARPTLVEPVYPVPSEIKENARQLQDLEPIEREELQARRRLWYQTHAKWERQQEALSQMESRIRESIAKSFLSYTRRCDNAYEMLVKLKDRFKPTNDNRKEEVIAKYLQLQRSPKNQEILTWLQRWDEIFDEGEELGIPHVKENQPLKDFINSVEEVDSGFYTYWKQHIRNIDKNQLPTLHQIVQRFRETRPQPKSRGTTFTASFQGKSAADEDETPKKRECLCGKKHLFKNCYYLIEAKRPSGWKPNPEIQRAIESKLEKIPKLRNAVEAIQKQEALKKKEITGSSSESPPKPASFTTMMQSKIPDISAYSPIVLTAKAIPEYTLRSSFILDSGATIHVCNSRERFRTFRQAGSDDYLYAGDSTVSIEGIGDVDIQVKTRDGMSTITLRNTAYAPQFHTNIVSLNKFIEKDVHWNTMSHELTYQGESYCKVEKHYGQWVLEYNDSSIEDTAFATKSTIPRISTASQEMWHRRMGHLHLDAIKKLPDAARGVKIGEKNSRPEGALCSECEGATASQQISRVPSQRATKPFERVHFDLIQLELAYNGDQWALHFVDDFSSMNFAKTLPSKAGLLESVKEFVQFIKTRYDCTVRILHMDNESSLRTQFVNWTQEMGITVEFTAPYSPSQNGRAERAGGMILARMRALALESKLPKRLWPEIIKAAIYLINRSPTKTLSWKSPPEVLQHALDIPNPKPVLSHIKVYSSRAYIKMNLIPKRDKVALRVHIGYLIGYESTTIY